MFLFSVIGSLVCSLSHSPAHTLSRVDCVTIALLLWFLPSSKFIFVVKMSRRVSTRGCFNNFSPFSSSQSYSAGLCISFSFSLSLTFKKNYNFDLVHFFWLHENYIHGNICSNAALNLVSKPNWGCSVDIFHYTYTIFLIFISLRLITKYTQHV